MISTQTKNRISKLENRRFDRTIQKTILSENYSKSLLKGSVKYALESMLPLAKSYMERTFEAAEKIKNHLTKGLDKLGIKTEYEIQGSVMTDTSIKLHSDIDLIVIIEKFISLERPQTPTFPYQGNPLEDLDTLRKESFNILDSIYDQVDNSKGKSLQVFPTNPKRKVDVVSSNWYNTNEYLQSGNSLTYRGIHIYDNNNKTRFEGHPFLQIERINNKDEISGGGLKKIIRLLKTLKVDADYEIKLTSFELTSIAYGIESHKMNKLPDQQLLLIFEARQKIDELVTNDISRNNLISPNGKEYVFRGKEDKVIELKKLRQELDDLMIEINAELGNLQKNINSKILY